MKNNVQRLAIDWLGEDDDNIYIYKIFYKQIRKRQMLFLNWQFTKKKK